LLIARIVDAEESLRAARVTHVSEGSGQHPDVALPVNSSTLQKKQIRETGKVALPLHREFAVSLRKGEKSGFILG
jgi:hypothetical protein